MRVRSCIPVWTYDEAFYTALLEGTKMAIRTDAVKGKGLFATAAIDKGEIIHQETSLVCSQNMDDALNAIPVCHHCLRSLETPRRVVARVCRSKRTALALPFGKLLAPETPVKCLFAASGCTAQFCSARCRETAWSSYHAVACSGRMANEEQREAYEAFFAVDWVQNGVDYSDTAMLALRAVTQFLSRHRLHGLSVEESYLPLAQLIKAPIDKFYFSYLLKGSASGEDEHADGGNEEEGEAAAETMSERRQSEDSLEAQMALYAELQRVKQDPLACDAVRGCYKSGERTKAAFVDETLSIVRRMLSFSSEEAVFLTSARWSELFGAVLLNGQERSPPSYYSLLKDTVEGALEDVGGAEKLASLEKDIAERHPHVKVDELCYSTHGQGIYAVGCLFNHSCEPNLQVIYSNNNDETLSVMAMRDIAKDEELCISYIEETLSFPKRQEQLYQHYLFECSCPKCSHDAKAFA